MMGVVEWGLWRGGIVMVMCEGWSGDCDGVTVRGVEGRGRGVSGDVKGSV